MGPTSESERRAVSERLRAAAKTKSGSADYLWNRLEIAVNGWKFGDDIDESYVFDNDVLSRLADLIDPATSATTFTPDVEFETYRSFPIQLWKCARCGEETIMMYDDGEPVAYPYCGAVVVSGDAE